MKDRDKVNIQMEVAGLVLESSSNAPIVILREPASGVCLPIWIGLAEATAIASALKKMELQRPMTHDLLANMVTVLGAKVLRITVTDLKETTFIAEIQVEANGGMLRIDARPSDAIALAVRVDAPIFVSPQVLVQAQAHAHLSTVPGEEGKEAGGSEEGQAGGEGETPAQENNFANIDKEQWEELLREMDPDDFKYKM